MTRFKVAFTSTLALISSVLGILYVPVLLMVACNIIDYATGLMASPKRREDINSYKSIRGITKKVCMWLLVVVGAILDRLIMYAAETMGIKPPLHYLVACIVAVWIVCNEIISILENMLDIGVALPPFLLPIVRTIRRQAEDAGKKLEGKEGEDDGNTAADS